MRASRKQLEVAESELGRCLQALVETNLTLRPAYHALQESVGELARVEHHLIEGMRELLKYHEAHAAAALRDHRRSGS